MDCEFRDVEVVKGTTFRVAVNLEPVHTAKSLENLNKPNWCAFGSAYAFRCSRTGKKYMLTKAPQLFKDVSAARDFLREVKLLRAFEHKNILATLDMYPSDHPNFEDFYLLQEFMDSSLDRLIASQKKPRQGKSKGTSFPEHTCRYFAYEIFCGLRHLHGLGLVHRDLKPENILVSSRADVKFSDFRFALALGNERARPEFAESVPAACYYRPPEFALLASACATAADVWSAGCIFAELIGGEPIFQGRNRLDQLGKILDILGRPGPDDLEWLPEGSAPRHVLEAQAVEQGRPWSQVYPSASKEVHEALSALLSLNPSKRPTATEAMRLPLFAEEHDDDHETPVNAKPIDWLPEDCTHSTEDIQSSLVDQCLLINPERTKESFARTEAAADVDSRSESAVSETVASEQESDHEYSVWLNKTNTWVPRDELHLSLMALDQFFKDSFGGLEKAFHAIDNNGSGEVVLHEWNERLGNLGFVDRLQVDEKKASRALFKLLASHDDGDDCSITKKELLMLDKLDNECSDPTWQNLLYGDKHSGCPEEVLRLRMEQTKARASLCDAQLKRSFKKTHPTIERRRNRAQTMSSASDPLLCSKVPFMTRSRPASMSSIHN